MYYIVLGYNMENKITQLRKGILELAILGALSRGRHYGYSLVKTISGTSDIDLTEGTIYPILGRLAKEGLVQSEWVEIEPGPAPEILHADAQGGGGVPRPRRGIPQARRDRRQRPARHRSAEERGRNLKVLSVMKETNNG